MVHRISDLVGRKVEAAIEDLGILAGIKLTLGWEVTPALAPAQGGGMSMVCMVAISVPVPVTGDRVLHMAPLMDPYADGPEVRALIKKLYEGAQAEAYAAQARAVSASNGGKASPGGLITP